MIKCKNSSRSANLGKEVKNQKESRRVVQKQQFTKYKNIYKSTYNGEIKSKQDPTSLHILLSDFPPKSKLQIYFLH